MYKPGTIYQLKDIFIDITDYKRIIPSKVKIEKDVIHEGIIDPYVQLVSLDPTHKHRQLPKSTLNLMYFQVIEYNDIWNGLNET